ncbi:hypothetical protein [Azospirillum thermophilum]|uniref:Uncharacterized protein n=1 Tax=Azospirillum thermophilum TaxID=2202148 RepID=A0A2S2CX19_9PROT|nr:hypothetical protein [Azospirillum thermophilum]AWK89063.1 hypothetical protein DEW08_23900 [Azospirillum thermophilum]
MQFLKALVVIMGVLIIAGFAVIGVELYKRMNDPARGTPEPDRPVAGKAVEDVVLDVPAGSRIGEIVVTGNRVLFKVTLPQGPDRLYVVDPRSGAVTATITAGKAVP